MAVEGKPIVVVGLARSGISAAEVPARRGGAAVAGDVRVGGNIGEALIGLVEGSTADTVFAVEVSSFQLEGVDRFCPQVAVFLNISPDHLDRHPSFEAYAEAKARIFANQTEEDWAGVNADDAAPLSLARQGRARVLPFHPRGEPASA